MLRRRKLLYQFSSQSNFFADFFLQIDIWIQFSVKSLFKHIKPVIENEFFVSFIVNKQKHLLLCDVLWKIQLSAPTFFDSLVKRRINFRNFG